MNSKILQLAQSPVILSDTDMQNFIKLMELPTKYINILKDAKEVIKNYYINSIVDIKDEKLIDDALLLIQGKKLNETEAPVSIGNIKMDNKHIMFDEEFLYSALYETPSHDLILHLEECSETRDNTEDIDIIRECMYNVSDKHTLEKIIIDGENKFIEFFKDMVSSEREAIESILETNIGNIFLINEKFISSIKQEMTQYRNITYLKIQEAHSSFQQLKSYWIQSEGGVVEDVTKNFMKGVGIGTLFGPIGIAVAVGANYLSELEKAEKQDAIESELIENWEKILDALYFVQLKEYHLKYQELRKKIAIQLLNNFKEAEQLALKVDKHSEFISYVNNEYYEMIKNKEFIKNFSNIDNYFN